MWTNHDMLNSVQADPDLLKFVRARPSVACSLYSRPPGLLLMAAALAQLSPATVVAAAAATTDVPAVAVLSVVAAVLARDDPSPPSAGSIVALYHTQW